METICDRFPMYDDRESPSEVQEIRVLNHPPQGHAAGDVTIPFELWRTVSQARLAEISSEMADREPWEQDACQRAALEMQRGEEIMESDEDGWYWLGVMEWRVA